MASSRVPGIPGVPAGPLSGFLQSLKDGIEQLQGRRGNKIDQLSAGASTAEIIAKVNEIVARLNP